MDSQIALTPFTYEPYSDLSLILSTQQIASLNKESFGFLKKCSFLIQENSKLNNPKDFSLQFPKKIKKILNLIKDLDSDSLAFPASQLNFLVNQIDRCLQNFFQYGEKLVNIDGIPELYMLAKVLKKNSPYHREIWQRLLPIQQVFFHSLSPWTENLTACFEKNYIWLLYEDRIPQPNQEKVVDFGDGYLHRITQIAETAHYVIFDLKQHPQLCLLRPQAQKPEFLDPFNRPKRGRIDEVFDIKALEKDLKHIPASSPLRHLLSNQMIELFNCYCSALFDACGLHAHLPTSISPQGEWIIWPKGDIEAFDKKKLTSTMLTDILNYFQAEQLWKWNLFEMGFGQTKLAIFKGHFFLQQPPLPTFFKTKVMEQSLKDRQANILSRKDLNATLQKQWDIHHNELEKKVEQQKNMFDTLKSLFGHKIFTLQEAIALDSRLIIKIKLLNLIKETPKNSTFEERYQCTEKMLALSFKKGLSQETFLQDLLSGEAARFYQTQQESKKVLRSLLYGMLIYEKNKKSLDHLCQSLYNYAHEQCELLADQLLKKNKQETIKAFVMFSDEFLKELKEVLEEENDEKELDIKLTLLQFIRNEQEEQKIQNPTRLSFEERHLDQMLYSILHDAMVKKHSMQFLTAAKNFLRSRDHS